MSDILKKFRVHIHSKPSPGSTYYSGYVDVVAEDENDARDRGPRELCRTNFKDRSPSSWTVDRVEHLY